MGRLRLADNVEISIVYADETPFGSLLSRRLGATVRECCSPVFVHWQQHGGAATVRRSDDVLAASLAGPLGALFVGPGQLREDVLYPPADRVRPAALVITREGNELARAPLSASFTRELARWIGDLARGEAAPRHPEARALYEELVAASAFTSTDVEPLPPADGHFVGHATVAVGDAARGRVLIDPYLLPRSERHPATYQPIVASQLDALVAVCITHCHPDHYALGSLLKLGADTRIFVPRVSRESALAVAMGPRLAELGFERVEELGWNEERAIPGGRILALPFYGEQPTTGERHHPDVRNQGNAYVVELGEKRYLAVADSGADSAGDAVALAESLRAKLGRIDVLFGGYRAFPLYPIEYLDTSVAEYLLFVPREAWLQRQKIMYDADELIDLAEAWRAHHVVPYACGGAPWHWERGLGPVLDEDQPARQTDPRPEDVVRAASFRTGSEDDRRGSPVDVALLRPGDGFRLSSNAAVLDVVRAPPHAWPFATPAETRWLQFNVAIAPGATDADRHENTWRLFRRVIPMVVDLKTTDRARTFFFQRKSPGLRLRVEAAKDAQVVEAALVYELERARSMGAIASYGSAVYEPEWRAFGGRAAMDAVHRYFDVDAMLFIDRLALSRSTMHGSVCDVVTWLALVADDLAIRCLSERGECFDVYASLLERHGIERDVAAAPLPAEILLTHGERDFLARYQGAARALADAIERLTNDGKLLVGRRALVANVIQFALNRHGLEPHEQQAVLNVLLATRAR